MTDPDEHVRRLASESLAVDDPTGWFERLYVEADEGRAVVPWDRGEPRALLVEWAERRRPGGAGRRALVVGCGLGADAEYVAGLGFETVAFDVSQTAVRAARRRFPDSAVQYVAADLLDPPAAWRGAFDLVLESLTVQSLPKPLHPAAIGQVAGFVAPGGTLVVIAFAGDEADDGAGDESEDGAGDEAAEGPPWPLNRAEVESFATGGLTAVRVDDVDGRWLAEFHRPA